MANETEVQPILWYPRVNDTIAIQGCDILGTFEGVFIDQINENLSATITGDISLFQEKAKDGLVRFIANEYEKHKPFLSQYHCFNPGSKYSRLCVIPLALIKEKDHTNNGKPKGQTSGLARKAPNKR